MHDHRPCFVENCSLLTTIDRTIKKSYMKVEVSFADHCKIIFVCVCVCVELREPSKHWKENQSTKISKNRRETPIDFVNVP